MTTLATPDAALLRAKWKWFVGLGFALAVLGVVALGHVLGTTLVTTLVVGGVLMVAGVVQFVGVFTHPGGLGQKVLFALLAILYVVVGFNMLTEPLRGVITLTYIVGFYLLTSGVLRIFGAFAGSGSKGLAIFTGFIDLLLGFWLITGVPVSGLALGFFVGLELVIAGITWMILGWQARKA